MSTHLVITCDNCGATELFAACSHISQTIAENTLIAKDDWQRIAYTIRTQEPGSAYFNTSEINEMRCRGCALTPLEEPACQD